MIKCSYRKYLANCTPPLIPYLGVNMGDLTYVYECMRKDKSNPARQEQYAERSLQFDQMVQQIEVIQKSCTYNFNIIDQVIEAIERQYQIPNGDYNAVYKMHYRISQLLENKKEVVVDDPDWKFKSLRLRSPKKSSVDGQPSSPERSSPIRSPTKGEMSPEEKSLTVPGKKSSRSKADMQVYLHVEPPSPATEQNSRSSNNSMQQNLLVSEPSAISIKTKKKGFYNFLKPLRKSSSKEKVNLLETPSLKKRVSSTDELRSLVIMKPKTPVAPKRHSGFND